LAKIWESVLEIEPVDVRDNFFELGGHSILAAILMARIQHEFGRELPLSALFQGGTIEHLASFLRREADSMSWSCLIEFQSSGSKTPLFFVHPGGGNVFSYYDLAHCLGSDRPFYAFQEPGLYKEQALFTRIEDMASYYIEALRTIQPEGPYLLGGWSFGGIVAFEMAQQLVAQDQRVSQLLVLDSYAPISREEYLTDDGEDEDEDDEHKEDAVLLIELFAARLKMTKEDIEPFEGDERIDYVLKRGIDENLFPPDANVARARAYLELFRTNARARRNYVSQVYPGTVTLFTPPRQFTNPPSDVSARSERIAMMIQDPTKGWSELATGGVRVVEIPGDHLTMVGKPHVETLALRIRECLDEAETVDG
jgi:thioesterase domain-containing protein/acyl carrier protein